MKADLPIKELLKRECAYDIAKQFHAYHSDLPWFDVLEDHHRQGYVKSSPTAFGMGKVITMDKRPGQKGWFINLSAGNMLELLGMLPCKLDFIAFCRNYKGKLHDYDFDVFVKRLVTRHCPQTRKEIVWAEA